MSLLLYKIIAAFIIFIPSVAIAYWVLKKRAQPLHNHFLEMGDALASGIFLGVALFHMLPDAITEFASVAPTLNFPLAEALCAAGFLFLLFFQRVSQAL